MKKKEDQRKERVKRKKMRGRKKMQVREKVQKPHSAEPCCGRRDEKLHAVVARGRFGHENADMAAASNHFWKLGCGRSAQDCGAKHMLKSQEVTNTAASAHLCAR